MWGDQSNAVCRDISMAILITGSLIKSESDREMLLSDLSNKYFPMDPNLTITGPNIHGLPFIIKDFITVNSVLSLNGFVLLVKQ